MPIITTHLTSGATRSMWQATWRESPAIARPLRRFLSLLSRFLTHGGRFSWTSIKVVTRQFGFENGRLYTSRWIEKLLAQAVALGLIRRVIHSAPGQPAVYEAVIPDHPGYRPVQVRPRGIRPKRLLASFRKETGTMTRMDWEGAARRDAARKDAEALPVITARHGGRCARCTGAYGPGDRITRHPEGWGHQDCAETFLGEPA